MKLPMNCEVTLDGKLCSVAWRPNPLIEQYLEQYNELLQDYEQMMDEYGRTTWGAEAKANLDDLQNRIMAKKREIAEIEDRILVLIHELPK